MEGREKPECGMVGAEAGSAYSLLADVHTHTCASGHAYGTIREMAWAAKERGLALLGISEHAPGIPGTCQAIYFDNLRVVPRQLYGVDLAFGCELNVLNDGTLSLEQRYIDKLDYAIVGLHGLCYQDAGVEKNTENLIRGMKNKMVSFVSHPDDDHTPLDYEKLVRAAREYHVALEVNNSSLLKQEERLNCVKNYRVMLELCQRLGVPIIVSSDAHDPSYVGRFAEAQALLAEVEFEEELIVNATAERFRAFIAEKNRRGE